MSAPPELVTAAALRDWPLPRPTGTKRSRGHVVIAGGSPSAPGAVLLAGLAALRVGAGVLALAVAPSVATALAVAVPEAAVTGLAMLETMGDAPDGADVFADCDAALIGPGIDNPQAAQRLLAATLAQPKSLSALVLDAFVLGVLPEADGVDALAGRAVFTPNSVEARFLLGSDDLDDEPVDVARRIADRYGVVVTFGGHIADPDGRTWSVPTGHAGLGTSGSGDVLAGCVAGLLARGADHAQAACWATFLHATAGDRLAARVGRLGFLARELVSELPLVLVQTEA